MTQQTKLPPKAKAFLTAYEVCGNVTAAAAAAKCDRKSHWHWMQKHTDYPKLFALARQAYCDSLEDEARRRAVEGVEEPIFQNGKQVGTRRKYSDTLLIFLLKGALPEKYADRTENVNHNTHKLDEAQIAEITRELIRRKYED